MRTAIFPGSFSPWHPGHEDILDKALKVFEHVTVLHCVNPDKASELSVHDPSVKQYLYDKYGDRVSILSYNGLAVEAVKQFNAVAMIRGLRNIQDFEYEKTMQYWNEDLGLTVPEVFFISDRSLVHVSSSALRMVEKAKALK